MFGKIKYWLALAIVTTGLSGLVYVAVQQDLRMTANDPQIELAEDTANALTNGQTLSSGVTNKIELSQSLAPFFIVLDKQNVVTQSSATLNGQLPKIPNGVLT